MLYPSPSLPRAFFFCTSYLLSFVLCVHHVTQYPVSRLAAPFDFSLVSTLFLFGVATGTGDARNFTRRLFLSSDPIPAGTRGERDPARLLSLRWINIRDNGWYKWISFPSKTLLNSVEIDAIDPLLPVLSPERGDPPQGKSDHLRDEGEVCAMCKVINIVRGDEFRPRGSLHREIEIIFCALWTAYRRLYYDPELLA